MIHSHNVRTLIVGVVLSTGLVLSSRPAEADVEAATASLKACITRHMPEERQQKDPDVKRLLSACQEELDELTKLLPPGTVGDIRQLIEEETERELKKGKGV